MKICATVAEMKSARCARAFDGKRVGFVPTMGALHDGHLSLVRAAKASCDVVAASIFVNPKQFGPNEDFGKYPRAFDRDRSLLESEGVDLLFAPSVEEMYPPGYRTWVDPGASGLEETHRPGHFRGVATVCLKLFTIVRPDVAYFGRKDAQQVAVLQRLVRDLALELEIRAVPTVRDADGLALSSRNAHLSAAERERALAIPRALATKDPARARALLADAGVHPDYVEVADLGGPTLAIAARVGSTRLIDNVLLEGDPT
jgi:pantoate--beta-alanine ligase